MPPTLTSLLSALVLTYWLSRLLLRLLGAMSNPPIRLILAHSLSWLILAVGVGFIKAYFVSFAYAETAVLILPQLLWLLIDALRGLGDRARAYGTSTRGSRPR